MTIHVAKNIQHWPLEKLVPYERNSRTHSDEQVDQIAASIREFGFTNPILVDSKDGIIAGHGRLMAAKRLALEAVPVIILDHLTEAQKRAYVIADNKLALNAGWDLETLASEIKELRDEEFDIDLLGFSQEELDEMLVEVEELDPQSGEDEVPEPPVEPVTKRGDVWILGNHRLMCGDSTMIDDVDRLMGGQKADMVFTDPPYGVSYKSNMSDKFEVIKNDDVFLDFNPILEVFMKDNTAAIIWTSQQVYPRWREMFEDKYKSTVIWFKRGGGMGDLKGDFAPNYEMALYCTKGSPSFAGKKPGAVWDISKDGGGEYVHPTQKPVALSEYGMDQFVGNGALVLDLFGGSGSTLIGCEKTKRKARVMELDEKYCDVIVKRWQDFTGKKAKHEDGRLFDDLKAD